MVLDWDDFHEHNHRYDLLHLLKEINPEFRCTLFAVPGLGSDSFWEAVPEWCELVPHGWLHPHPREAENWTKEQTLDVLLSSHPRFAEGWKSPGWQISEGTYEALLELDWFCADHYENDERRPEGLRTHVLGQGNHWHGHIQDVCGNGLEERFAHVAELVRNAESFELVSEVVQPWRVAVAA